MLPRNNRLKKEKDFGNVLRSGRKIKEGPLILKLARVGGTQTRLGISVSKRISKKATVRNKVRRRIAFICGFYLPKAKPGWDIVLSVLPGIETKNFSEIETLVKKVFLKVGIMPSGSKTPG
jgi:ribonuclease P protein component